jgi:hypothetical protein
MHWPIFLILSISTHHSFPYFSIVFAPVDPIFTRALRTEGMLKACLLYARHRNYLRLKWVLKNVVDLKLVDIYRQKVVAVVLAEEARVCFARLVWAEARILVNLAEIFIDDWSYWKYRVLGFGQVPWYFRI